MYSSLNGIRQHFKTELSHRYSPRETEQLFYRLLSTCLGISKTDAILSLRNEIPTEKQEVMQTALDKLKAGTPVQYIDNTAFFMDDTFYVDDSVLIPRPETEELVKLLLDENSEAEMQVLDIGTGSGVIPICLSKNRPNWVVRACDISNEALVVARRNANDILKHSSVAFYKEDILSPKTQYAQSLDAIVSNPPYVLDSDKQEMKDQVLDFEPHLALFVPDNDPLLFYASITDYAKRNLKKGIF